MRTLSPLLVYALSASALSPATVELVKARLKDAAKKRVRVSWEIGTRAQALLELEAPSVSVFTASSIPGSPAVASSPSLNSTTLNAARLAFTNGQLDDVVGLSHEILANKQQGTLPLMKDGSSADPASNGVGMIIANWTEAQGSDFAAAASDQLTWLLEHVPRSSKGAISHRNSEVQLWSDFIYMVPPFLAYYGASTSNASLVSEAHNQIKLYRDVLRDKPTGIWQHIRQGSFEDRGLWSTGNGWAAMGIMRVAATIRAAGYSSQFKEEMNDFETWTAEILDGMWPLITEEGLFYNYANDPKTFLDAAGTALMVASTYRAATMFNNTKHLDIAEKVYKVIGGTDSDSTSSSSISSIPEPTGETKKHRSIRQVHHRVQLSQLKHTNENHGPIARANAHHRSETHVSPRASVHLTSDGWLNPVVDPHSFKKLGEHSAEGQAFVIMMYASRNDYLVHSKLKIGARPGGFGANVVGFSMTGGNNGLNSTRGAGGLTGVGNAGVGLVSGGSANEERKNSDYKSAGFEVGTIIGAVGAVLAWIM
ncbi:Glycoside hydrolase family 105 protein [Rhizoctonia solani]|uniref:Glycoside hydrolase family 105 protein n=1 Tax=Rhizoctonia solani TaxID=456999 RepID=A0A8H7M1R7_9AGAM|nr:Glycoside hydrolase family 105 protein [Rhizoctonia solani]